MNDRNLKKVTCRRRSSTGQVASALRPTLFKNAATSASHTAPFPPGPAFVGGASSRDSKRPVIPAQAGQTSGKPDRLRENRFVIPAQVGQTSGKPFRHSGAGRTDFGKTVSSFRRRPDRLRENRFVMPAKVGQTSGKPFRHSGAGRNLVIYGKIKPTSYQPLTIGGIANSYLID